MTLDEAHAILSQNCSLNVGQFYGNTSGLSLGTGLIYKGVLFPTFDLDERLFVTVEGVAYVLTHECDVDPSNRRAFNSDVVICPLIPLAAFLDEYSDEFADADGLRSFLAEVARRGVNRVVYLPPAAGDLDHGCFLYLNALASTDVTIFESVNVLAALSQYGLRYVDAALQNHFMREKAEPLGLPLGSGPKA